MSRFVKLTLEVTDWGADENTHERNTRVEFSGTEKPWMNVNHFGDPLQPHEVEALNEIIGAYKKFATPAKEQK